MSCADPDPFTTHSLPGLSFLPMAAPISDGIVTRHAPAASAVIHRARQDLLDAEARHREASEAASRAADAAARAAAEQAAAECQALRERMQAEVEGLKKVCWRVSEGGDRSPQAKALLSLIFTGLCAGSLVQAILGATYGLCRVTMESEW